MVFYRKQHHSKMNAGRLFGIGTLFLCVLCTGSCSDDDPNPFPEGTSSLRMMNEDNGKVLLGNSDVYITGEGNFNSNSFPIFDRGQKQGISDIDLPDFVNMAPAVAVVPGHGYVICSPHDVRTFDSRKNAIREDANVYRVFVDSWIEDKEGDKAGANVYFLLGSPVQDEKSRMPAWGSCIGSLGWDFQEDKSKELSLSFPSGDIEVSFFDSATAKDISYSIRNNTLTFCRTHSSYRAENHEMFVRHKNVYTEVYIEMVPE